MAFIQTIAFSTSRMDEMQKVMDAFTEAQSAASPGLIGTRVLKDRDNDNAYLVIAEFENYELAMQNSARPETNEMAQKMGELTDGPPTYGNYDLVREETV
jgi:quinol monooxygenase YgiN